MKTIIWFRNDLRLQDNPALWHGCQNGDIIPVYIDDTQSNIRPMGSASKVWLYKSLQDLNTTLGHTLHIIKGDAQKILLDIAQHYNATAIHWNRRYDWDSRNRDADVKSICESAGIKVTSYNGSLLWEPWHIAKKDKTPYKVFTPYYRKGCLGSEAPRPVLPRLDTVPAIYDIKHCKAVGCCTIDDLELLPICPQWHTSVQDHWDLNTPDSDTSNNNTSNSNVLENFEKSAKQDKSANIETLEQKAEQRLYDFLDTGLTGYKEKRNHPALPNTSGLSPYLRFGNISPNTIWHAVQWRMQDYSHIIPTEDTDNFLTELGWREFSYYLSFHYTDFATQNWKKSFDTFPWQNDTDMVKKWQTGQTGYPIIDAGMRQLWQTGTMHNRIRMVTASFLVKNLLTHWKTGEQWFWDCLVDADSASNPAGWQWVAGSGADAAPYFRIFNPVLQGQRFDKDGEYIRKYVPELAKLPTQYIFEPYKAPPHVLQDAGIILGKTYPHPMIDIAHSRNRALQAYKETNNALRK